MCFAPSTCMQNTSQITIWAPLKRGERCYNFCITGPVTIRVRLLVSASICAMRARCHGGVPLSSVT